VPSKVSSIWDLATGGIEFVAIIRLVASLLRALAKKSIKWGNGGCRE